ncbi:MAG: AAA family ATPase [Candidatus Rokubacteria bacterium]|nr:AAA family ATPase [Candidatus Rokubacteria bacterium]
MYLEFFGLKAKPFNNTPDPKFLYLTPGHREALAHLVYGVQEQKGFIVLTGEVGTGKTTLLRALLERLDGSNTAVAFVFHSALSFDDVLEYMLEDFGLGKVGKSRVECLVALNDFLIERRRVGQNTAVILDEAQNLHPSTLEQIRLLSNAETATDKLLQIVLVGQPELGAKLELAELRQLRQRIGLRCAISPLTAAETGDYIRSRLRIAGARDLSLFTERAVRRIAQYAGGIPRVVNLVCDHCLLIGYADQTRRIDRDIVERAIEYFEEGALALPRRQGFAALAPLRGFRWLVGALIASVIGILAGLALQPDAVAYVSDLVSGSLSSLADALGAQ